MNLLRSGTRCAAWLSQHWAVCLAVGICAFCPAAIGQVGQTNIESIVLLTFSGVVEVAPSGTTAFAQAQRGQILHLGDNVRTGRASRASVRLSDKSVLRIYELTTLEIKPPQKATHNQIIDVKAGATYFFNRDKPQETQFETPSASGAIRGTEFELVVNPDGSTKLSLLDGEVALTNAQGSLQLQSGEQSTVALGQAPQKTALLNAVNIIQWTLYYPAVLDPAELGLNPAEESALESSLTAYRLGNLPKALHEYPAGRVPVSDAEKAYFTELLLSVGLVDQAEIQLGALGGATNNTGRLAASLRELIAAVKHTSWENATAPESASQWLAESYYQQSRAQLSPALAAAREAVKKSPSFAFAWARVAELEFGFGRTGDAIEALDKSLALGPQNPEAIALRGFLFSAQNRMNDALKSFNDAIAVDGALANAWLGRGLCEIHEGHQAQGRADLLVAAALEPQRAVLRSYLGKAFGDAGDDRRANKEFRLARKLDPNDPTSWLYAALLEQQENRINDAMGDLQSSQQRNDNRSLFRSSLLLDQDRAVGSVNLASVYRDAGMTNVSVREAARAVNDDYANDSAHLFLSDAYNDLRDPTQFNLRYETAWFNEYLLANILAPVGGGRLSQEVSGQEYSKLFQADGLSLASSSDVRTDRMFHEQASQFGTVGNTAYAVDLDYRHNDGVRVNNDLDDVQLNFTVKQQVGPQDTALLLVQYQTIHSGDNFQYYDPATQAQPYYRYDENQAPIVVGAWHHEWGPGMHTIALVGRLSDAQHFADQAAPEYLLGEDSHGAVNAAVFPGFDVDYHNSFTIYSAEVNQICEWDRVTLSLGSRYQNGTFEAQDVFSNPTELSVLFPPNPVAANSITSDFDRVTGYGYATVKLMDSLWLTGGVAYDEVKYPDNYRQAPVSTGDDTRSQVGPKAGLVWDLNDHATLRGSFTRSLGGVSLDESYRLEPTQLAGFPQAFRSLISESVAGSVAAPGYETEGLALDLKLGPRTYAGIELDRLLTDVRRTDGAFALVNGLPPAATITTPEQLNFTERDLSVNLDQLLGREFALGADYKLTLADFHDVLPDVPASVLASADQQDHAVLNQAGVHLLFNHASGFFAKLEAQWYKQENRGYSPALPGDDFFQENVYGGYRFFHRRAELMLGLLNLGGGDYHLNPLTPYEELPRKRVFEARLNLEF